MPIASTKSPAAKKNEVLERYQRHISFNLNYLSHPMKISENGFNKLVNEIIYGPEAAAVQKLGHDSVLYAIWGCMEFESFNMTDGSIFDRESPPEQRFFTRVIRWIDAYIPNPKRREQMQQLLANTKDRAKSDNRMHYYVAGLTEVIDLFSDGQSPAKANVLRDGATPEKREMVALMRAGDHEVFNRLKPSRMIEDEDEMFEDGVLELTNVDLRGLDLRKFNFDDTEFSGSDLSDTNLSGARLKIRCWHKPTKFHRAKLTRANFAGSTLWDVGFGFADLKKASFFDSDVGGSDFSQADLRGADLTGCEKLAEAKFVEAWMDTAQMHALLRSTLQGPRVWDPANSSPTERRQISTHDLEVQLLQALPKKPKRKPAEMT